ncbi:MAG: tetratricopeptide repeat protein [Cyanobacteria bacterium SIG28]|nr:tetratricopeptide repeat protein [Cyanobacteria bacterium SIG28]
MRRRRKNFDIYIIIFLLIMLIGHLIYNSITAEDRGITAYKEALEIYKNADFEKAYQLFAKVPSGSGLKESALFRQARCATNMGRKELAIKKYDKIVHSHSKSTIVPISQYNMANLMYEINDKRAKSNFKGIIKKYPTSDYAIASEYFIGMLELQNLPEKEKYKKQAIERAAINFKTYIQKSPGGRYSLKSIEQLKKLDIKLKNYDNLLIAKSYYENGEYDNARDFLNKTTLAESWTDFAKTEFKLGNYDKVKYYTDLGLKKHANSVKQEDLYEVIDNYILTYPTRTEGIKSLIAGNYNSGGADYIDFLNCNDVVTTNAKIACFNTFYEKYPNGQFSAEALYNIFLSKYLQKKYSEAQRLGYLHLEKFPNVKSSPAVTYYMGRIANNLKHYEVSTNYLKRVLSKYPDSYYAYRANYNLYKADGVLPFIELTPKPVVFPFKKSVENNLVVKLALLKDYDLVEELCKKDKFIQSWVAYQKGNYTISSILARKAMEELTVKPPFSDLRWRLIYPLHYYDKISASKRTNNSIILQSILKEESHFNPEAKSFVGASGLMQLMPATFSEIAKYNGISGDILDEISNIKAGSLYYENLRKALNEKDLYAISAYNGGIGSVKTWMSKINYSDTDEFVEQIPYPETKNYVKKVLRSYWVYGNIY